MSEVALVAVAVVVGAIAAPLANRYGLVPEWITVNGPLITVHTGRGRTAIERLSRPRRFWRAGANVGVVTAALLGVVSFLAVLIAARVALTQDVPSAVTAPRNVVAIPGVNEFLPLSIAPALLVALVVGLAVHEGCHGILARVEDVEIDSLGVIFLSVLPFGAFVDPEDESAARAGPLASSRIFAAGITGNLVVAVLVFALLFGPVTGAIAATDGVAVGGTVPGAPADQAGLGSGDVVTEVDGTPVTTEAELYAALDDSGDRAELSLASGETTTLQRSVVVTAAAPGAAVETGTTIEAVNGTAVTTEREFRSALRDRPIARLSTDGGEQTIEAGVPIAGVTAGGPAADAGVPENGSVTLVAVDGERTLDAADLHRVLDGATPGETVTLELLVDGERQTTELTLGTHPDADAAWLGVQLHAGIGGLSVSDLGIAPFPADEYLAFIGGEPVSGADSVLGAVEGLFVVLMLPLAGMIGLAPYDFPGFVGELTGFYTVPGALAPIEPLVFVAATGLFWVGWLNVLLALFNCIPAYPLDGGRLLQIAASETGDRIGLDGAATGTAVTGVATILMVVGVALLIVGPRL